MQEPKTITNNQIKFAYYDSITDTIANASKYSYSWFHEMRHRTQSIKTPINKWSINISVYSYYLGIGLLYFLIIGSINYIEFFKLLGIVYTPYIVLLTIIELDAYIFGTINWLKYKNKRKLYK